MFYRLSVTAIIIVLLAAPTALGQLSKADIDSLREVGQREGWTFTVGENEATQRPIHELCGARLPDDWQDNIINATAMPTAVVPLPSSFDWRQQGGVTPIKNQGQCGSCWAFATVGVLECNIAIRDDEIVDLSEQYLVSCNFDGWDCIDGGNAAHNYHLIDSHPDCKTDLWGQYGPVYEATFPYVAADVPCQMCFHQTQYCLEDWGYLLRDPDTHLPYPEDVKEAIMRYGPVFVYILVDDAFRAYNGGVFNSCPTLPIDTINHAVCLVGWDDNQGSEGVWILRNSWGSTTWGEQGYMLIEYGCLNVGVGVNYVDYDLPEVVPYADVRMGWVPLDVNFDAIATVSVSSWSWEFGDGGTAYVKDPSHLYNQRGSHDVTVEGISGLDVHTNTFESYIIAIADTIKGDSTAGLSGQQVVVTLSAYNATPVGEIVIPVEWAGDLNLAFKAYTMAGCRTEGFSVTWPHYDAANKRFTIRLRRGVLPELAIGEGPILKLTFTISDPSTAGQSANIAFDGYTAVATYVPKYSGSAATYEIASKSGKVVSKGCCQLRGNIDGDTDVDLSDVGYFVDWTFSNDAAAPCSDDADVDGNGKVNIEDLVYLVNYLYGTGEPPPAPCPE